MKKWFKRITAGAVAAVVFGMALMPQGEARAASAKIQVWLVFLWNWVKKFIL